MEPPLGSTTTPPSASTPPPSRARSPTAPLARAAAGVRVAAVGLFLAFHMVAVVTWLLPAGHVRGRVLHVVDPYLRAVEARQNWSMFAPDPLRARRRVLARARLADPAPGAAGNSGADATASTVTIDLTTPVERQMRSWSLARSGKMLKVLDRVASQEKPHTEIFTAHLCHRLAAELSARVVEIELLREESPVLLDRRTQKTSIGKPVPGRLSLQRCP